MCGINSFPLRGLESGTGGGLARRWERWAEVLLDEPLSQSNTAQMLEHFLFWFIYIYICFFFSCLLLQHYWIIRVVYFPCLAELTLRKLCKDIGKEVDTVFDPNTRRFGSSLEVGHTWKRLRAAVAEAICCGGNTAARGREGAREGAAEMQEKQSQSVLFSSGFGSASEGRQIRRGRDTRAKFPHLGIMTCSHKCIISGRKPPCCRIN